MFHGLKKRMAQILSALFAVTTVAAFMPQMVSQVYAAAGDPAMTLGTAVLGTKINTTDAQILNYGGMDWYVIACDGKDDEGNPFTYEDAEGKTVNLYPEGTITLLAKSSLSSFETKYAVMGDDSQYAPSLLKKKIDGEGGILSGFSESEQEGIQKRTLEGGNSNYGEEGYDLNKIFDENAVENVALWPLSAAEAGAVSTDIRLGYGENWWLRTTGLNKSMAQYVNAYFGDGSIKKFGADVYTGWTYARPAFNLDADAVLFTSAAVGGKISGKAGINALQPLAGKTNSGNEWKVTVIDSAHKNFTVDPSKVKFTKGGIYVAVPYSGAVAGENEYISVIITDKPVSDPTAQIKYYGRVGKASASPNASVMFMLKEKMQESDRLYVFNEQVNGDGETDYASALCETVHEMKKTEAVDATCTNDGNIAYWTCNTCHRYFRDEAGTNEIEENGWVIKAGHSLTGYPAKEATCAEAGNEAYWVCNVCHGYFSDENGEHAIEKDSWVIPPNEKHKWDDGKVTKAPTTTSTGVKTFTCTVCNATKTETISKLEPKANPMTIKVSSKTFKLADVKKKAKSFSIGTSNAVGKVSYTPDAKAKKAKIKVTAKGKVTIPKNCKKGTYKITVKATGDPNYKAGSKTVTIKVK